MDPGGITDDLTDLGSTKFMEDATMDDSDDTHMIAEAVPVSVPLESSDIGAHEEGTINSSPQPKANPEPNAAGGLPEVPRSLVVDATGIASPVSLAAAASAASAEVVQTVAKEAVAFVPSVAVPNTLAIAGGSVASEAHSAVSPNGPRVIGLTQAATASLAPRQVAAMCVPNVSAESGKVLLPRHALTTETGSAVPEADPAASPSGPLVTGLTQAAAVNLASRQVAAMCVPNVSADYGKVLLPHHTLTTETGSAVPEADPAASPNEPRVAGLTQAAAINLASRQVSAMCAPKVSADYGKVLLPHHTLTTETGSAVPEADQAMPLNKAQMIDLTQTSAANLASQHVAAMCVPNISVKRGRGRPRKTHAATAIATAAPGHGVLLSSVSAESGQAPFPHQRRGGRPAVLVPPSVAMQTCSMTGKYTYSKNGMPIGVTEAFCIEEDPGGRGFNVGVVRDASFRGVAQRIVLRGTGIRHFTMLHLVKSYTLEMHSLSTHGGAYAYYDIDSNSVATGGDGDRRSTKALRYGRTLPGKMNERKSMQVPKDTIMMPFARVFQGHAIMRVASASQLVMVTSEMQMEGSELFLARKQVFKAWRTDNDRDRRIRIGTETYLVATYCLSGGEFDEKSTFFIDVYTGLVVRFKYQALNGPVWVVDLTDIVMSPSTTRVTT